uniref:N-acetylgalactosaminide beta-1,3-galactosyltransferase n=1 Tax=Steinernema glaseri TaxID=37863 RepID=A0A1I7Z321_9BILA
MQLMHFSFAVRSTYLHFTTFSPPYRPSSPMKGAGTKVKSSYLRTIVACVLTISLVFFGLKYLLDHRDDLSSEEFFQKAYLETISTHHTSVHISSKAASLPSRGLLFCFVLTAPKFHSVRVPSVSSTWLPRCDHGEVFTSSETDLDETVPYRTLFRHLDDSYDTLFWKSKLALQYSYTRISPFFDWYLKADDDTYVVVENLKKLLSKLDPAIPYYLGFRMKPYLRHGYNSGGAGYVLSRAAMGVFSSKLFPNSSLCPFNVFEDVGIGQCFERVEIFPGDARDSSGRQRFNLFTPSEMIRGGLKEEEQRSKWFFDDVKTGYESISPEVVSFHHVSPELMEALEVAIYRIRIPS